MNCVITEVAAPSITLELENGQKVKLDLSDEAFEDFCRAWANVDSIDEWRRFKALPSTKSSIRHLAKITEGEYLYLVTT